MLETQTDGDDAVLIESGRPPLRAMDTPVGPARPALPDPAPQPGPRHRSSAQVWRDILHWLDIPPDEIGRLRQRAQLHGTSFQRELIAAGIVPEEDLFRAIAAAVDLEFWSHVEPERLLLRDDEALVLLRRPGGVQIVRSEASDGPPLMLIAPDRVQVESLVRFLTFRPALKERLRIVPPAALRAAVIGRMTPVLAHRAAEGLFERFPAMSARVVVNGWQGAAAGALMVGLPLSFILAPGTAIVALHAISSIFFFSCVLLRLLAAREARPPQAKRLEEFDPAELPVYSLLVALYREAPIVPDLLVALGRIVWPRSKLEIKLVCEADDAETLAAIRTQALKPWIEVIEVPPGTLRTKPKALAFALPMVSGDFVALYDAEDKPHPLQLLEAWQRFREADMGLACLQAPLTIANRNAGPIARLFAFEYAALFRGLLPWLSRRGLFLPLGGTSNHFRRSVLDEVGAWDAYNVTEDADLGLRLCRFGYRAEVIDCPTYEDAPETLRVWLPQRTRWLKGWTQTWLVHMRDPAVLARDLGFGSFLMAQVLCAGMVASALVHPFFLLAGFSLVSAILAGLAIGPAGPALLAVDLVNISCGYLAFLLLGTRTLTPREAAGFWKVVLFMPVYWMLMSVAAWRAMWQLYRAPFLWEKTPHKPSRRMMPASAPPAPTAPP